MHQKDAEISFCSLWPSLVLVLLFWCTLSSKDLIVACFCPTIAYYLKDLLAMFFFLGLNYCNLKIHFGFSFFFKWEVTSYIETLWLGSMHMERENFTISSTPGILQVLSDYQITKELWFSFGISGKANSHCTQRLCLGC